MDGGAANDTYIVDDIGDIILEAANGGVDLTQVAIGTVGGSYTLADQVENGTLTNTVAFTLIGNAIANSLTGNAADNTLDGGQGNDTLLGRAGNDLLIGGVGNDLLTGGAGIDTASYAGAAAAVTVNLAITTAQNTGGAGTDTLTQIENLIGSAFNDILTGGAGANRIDGGAGDDLFIVAAAADHTADEAIIGGSGTDELRFTSTAASTLTVSANTTGVERIVIGTGTGASAVTTGTTAINVNASALSGAVNIVGNNGANILTGGAGADTLSGEIGADRLNGGLGNDLLIGGAGADTFIFDSAPNAISNIDTISDFSVVDDTIALENAIFTALGVRTGVLSAAAFRVGAAAGDADDRVIYNSANGTLIYDSNGNAAGGAVQIATLATGLALTNLDFVII